MTDPKDSEDEILKGPSLSADGHLEQRFARVEPPGPPQPKQVQEEKLELEERAPPRTVEERVETFREERRARSSRPWALKLFITTLLLGVMGLGALLYFRPSWVPPIDGVRESSLLEELTSGGEAQPIIISSSPTGATLFIGGKAMGQTPWAGENRWRGETPLKLELRGYKPWQGTLKGGQPQTFDITLKK